MKNSIDPQGKENAMGQLRDRMEADLKIGGYSPNTQRVYLYYAYKFAEYHKRSPSEMDGAR